MRSLLIFFCLIVIYYALKTIVRSAFRAYHEEVPRRRIKGEEMVLDPQCRTYIVKDRAITRRIQGATHFFCSEACAQGYEKGHGG